MAGSQANTGQWFEPETPYAKIKGKEITPRENESKSTIYPFNKVTETESGHIVEFDDTPGAERIQVFHRSGTFEEIHPNGDKVEKIVRDQYVSILRDSNVHIDGFSNLTVDKGLKIFVNRDILANIQKGSCIQCGQQGHYLQNDKCALRDRPLMDKACAKCGQGLHSADDCLKVFQKQYVAQQPQDANPANPNQDQLKGN